MKHILIILIVGLLSFGLGWWVNELQNNVSEEVFDEQDADSLITNDKNLLDSVTEIQTKNSKRKTFHDFASDDQFIRWAPNHADTTGYLCELTLHRITALYWYHGQCAYDYFTYITSDTTLEVLWSYRRDCILNMDFLEKSHGLKSFPKHGDTFATFSLSNDSTINVNYRFPSWIKRVNLIAKDSLFPTTYYLIRNK